MRLAIFPGWLLRPALLWAVLLGPCCGLAATPSTPLSLELNKLAPLEGGTGCRAYFVIANPGTDTISELQLDLVLFGTDGIITGRVAVEVGPLPADKTVVRLFDLTGTKCDSIGHVLLNDVLSCRVESAPPAAPPAAGDTERAACLDRIKVSSLTSVPLTK